MTYIGSWAIDNLLTFYVNTTRFDTGVGTDADSVPTYRVYEDETSTAILTGSMALLDSTNTAGFYSEQITLSAANGFEQGKSYAIYIAATVNSVAGAAHKTFQIRAEVNANVTQIAGSAVSTSTAQLGVNVVNAGGTAWGSGAITAASIATGAVDADAIAADAVTEIQAGLATSAAVAALPTAATIADAVWDEDATAHQTVGTFGLTVGDSGGSGFSIFEFVSSFVSLDAAQVTAAVWDIATTGHTTSGTFGEQAKTDVDAILAQLVSGDVALTLSDILGYVDDIPAVKAKTDSLTYTVAGVVDSNIQRVNDVTVTGDGSGGTPWGP